MFFSNLSTSNLCNKHVSSHFFGDLLTHLLCFLWFSSPHRGDMLSANSTGFWPRTWWLTDTSVIPSNQHFSFSWGAQVRFFFIFFLWVLLSVGVDDLSEKPHRCPETWSQNEKHIVLFYREKTGTLGVIVHGSGGFGPILIGWGLGCVDQTHCKRAEVWTGRGMRYNVLIMAERYMFHL